MSAPLPMCRPCFKALPLEPHAYCNGYLQHALARGINGEPIEGARIACECALRSHEPWNG